MIENAAKNQILVLNFGSQFTQLIARRVRELSVYCEIMSCDVDENEILNFSPKAIILSGGPESVYCDDFHKVPDIIFKLQVPILGICYGQQLMCETFGGIVSPASCREFGKTEIEIVHNSKLIDGVWDIGSKQIVWMSHSDFISSIPQGFVRIAKTKNSPFAIISNEERKLYGLQFHPEVTHTSEGKKIIENFVLKIAGCKQDWSISSFIDVEIETIKQTVGDKGLVICALSGGIDSAVTAALIKKAVGDRLINIFINTGLLREGEHEQILSTMRDICGFKVIYIDASKRFLSVLGKITDPEEKRKIIGKTFIEIFQSVTKDYIQSNNQRTEDSLDISKSNYTQDFELDEESINYIKQIKDDVRFLAQGTIYPDVIESSSNIMNNSSNEVTIKSHHNVGGLPKNLAFKLVEPIKFLFKDEVRTLASMLNLPDEIIKRHPFPGPGLAIRILGEISKEKCDILRKVDAIFIEELSRLNLYNKIWQAFAVLLPVRSVGVIGDARHYGYVCALRAVTSLDGMSADFFEFDITVLGNIANRIINEVHDVGRVVYDITSKPPATVEWE